MTYVIADEYYAWRTAIVYISRAWRKIQFLHLYYGYVTRARGMRMIIQIEMLIVVFCSIFTTSITTIADNLFVLEKYIYMKPLNKYLTGK